MVVTWRYTSVHVILPAYIQIILDIFAIRLVRKVPNSEIFILLKWKYLKILWNIHKKISMQLGNIASCIQSKAYFNKWTFCHVGQRKIYSVNCKNLCILTYIKEAYYWSMWYKHRHLKSTSNMESNWYALS